VVAALATTIDAIKLLFTVVVKAKVFPVETEVLDVKRVAPMGVPWFTP